MKFSALVLALTAAGVSAPAFAGDPVVFHATVYVFDREYSQNNPLAVPPTAFPDDPTIQLGQTVRWVLISGMHTVTAAAGQSELFDSGDMMDQGQTFFHTFNNLGDFNYYCMHHGFDLGGGQAGGMAGVGHVVPTPAAAALFGLGALAARRRR